MENKKRDVSKKAVQLKVKTSLKAGDVFSQTADQVQLNP